MFVLKFLLFVHVWLWIVFGNIRILWLEWRLDREDRLQRRLTRVENRVMARERRLQQLGW